MGNFFIADMCSLPGSIIILRNKSLYLFPKKFPIKVAKSSKGSRENKLRKKRKMRKA